MSEQEPEAMLLTRAEIYKLMPNVQMIVDTYASQFNIVVIPHCEQYSDGNVHLTMEFLGALEHIEHITQQAKNNGAFNIVNGDSTITIPQSKHEQVNQLWIGAMASALCGNAIYFAEGQQLYNHRLQVGGQFIEWSLDEMQIIVWQDSKQHPQTWNLADVLLRAGDQS